MTSGTDRYKPAVTRNVLLFLAGIVWLLVGGMLVLLAGSWLSAAGEGSPYPPAGAGIALALLVHHFGFLKIANRNLARVLRMTGKKCLFAFVPWRSYLIIAVMIALGATLRHSAIPKRYLAILYLGIGLALALSSIRYLRIFVREVGRHDAP